MSKRKKIVVASSLMSLLLLGLTQAGGLDRLVAIAIASILSVSFSGWALSGSIRKDATRTTLILPALFTLGVSLFWFLLPSEPLAQVPVLVVYGLGLYAIMLTANIYCVSVSRSIALLRAAKSVGFVMTLFTTFLLFDALFSLRASFLVNVLVSIALGFLLVLPSLWIVKLEPKISKDLVLKSFFIAFLIAQTAGVLYFWPTTVAVSSIFITSVVYVALGTMQAYLDERLFSSTLREFLIVGAIVFTTMILSTRWR